MTTLLVVILHDPTYISELLETWKNIGVPGTTVLQSVGGHSLSTTAKHSGLQNIIGIFDQVKSQQRTLFSIIEDDHLLERAIAEADRLVQGFDSPQSGILFTLPINKVLGLKKWEASNIEQKEKNKKTIDNKERAHQNILQWYKDEIETKYGHDVLKNWSKQKNTPISRILSQSDNVPILAKVDTPLIRIAQDFYEHPEIRIACVINNEDRLVGLVDFHTIAEILMIPVIPEIYLDTPDGYEKAVQFADVERLPVAAEIMKEAIFISIDDNLQSAYYKMQQAHMTELPVVTASYHVKGYITLQEILKVCYPPQNIQ